MNSPRGLSVWVVFLLAASVLHADSSYQDAQQRFSLNLPDGWTSTAMEGGLQVTNGRVFVAVLVTNTGKSASDLLTDTVRDIGSHWTDFHSFDPQKETLGGQSALFSMSLGVNASGQRAILAVYAMVIGERGYLLAQSGPLEDMRATSAQLDGIARSFRTTAGTIAPRQPSTGESGSPTRKISFNGQPLTADDLRKLENLERLIRIRLPNLSYWYDNRSGAIGLWGGPTAAFIPAGLLLGPIMPANCSTGGTGVFVNGREVHPLDVLAFSQLTQTPVIPGRYWLDAQGFGGIEGGPPLFNVVVLVQQAQSRGSGGGAWSQRLGGGGYVSGDGHSSVMFKDSTGHGVMVGPN